MDFRKIFSHSTALGLALMLILGGLVPFFEVGIANAYGVVTSRNIELSDSTLSATNVTYQVGFTTASTSTIKGIVVDFCSSTPIIGDNCTAPAGFTVGTPTVATSGGANTGLSGVWTAASANSGRTLTLKNASGGSISSGTAVIFTLSTATNPSAANTTYYARILDFPATTDVDTYTGDSTGQTTTNVVDAGGIALSTANNIVVTAKVQETLTFCVYTGANCGSGGSNVTLGDNHGVLSTSGPFVDKTTKYDVATNASSGAIVRLKGDTLKSGSNSITATGAGATSATGTSQFGLCSYESTGSNLTVSTSPTDYTGVTGGTCLGTTQSAGTGTPGGDNGATFAFNTTNTNTTFGEKLATESAGAISTGVIPFIGNISATQQAGIYTTTLIFVATGTY